MNIGKDKKRPTRRRFYLPLALTLVTYSILPLTLSESSAARTPRASNNVELVKISGGQNTYLQPGGIKVLAEGYHSKITKPFVAVVRDEETYAALTRLDE